jgi:hypothetical protein
MLEASSIIGLVSVTGLGCCPNQLEVIRGLNKAQVDRLAKSARRHRPAQVPLTGLAGVEFTGRLRGRQPDIDLVITVVPGNLFHEIFFDAYVVTPGRNRVRKSGCFFPTLLKAESRQYPLHFGLVNL